MMIRSIVYLVLVSSTIGCYKENRLKDSEKPNKPFVLIKVTSINVSLSSKGDKTLLNIHVEGVAPKSGYLAEMLIPRQLKLSEDGYAEYIFQAIPNVEDGVIAPTTIVVDSQFLFNPQIIYVKGIRVFGADNSIIETKITK